MKLLLQLIFLAPILLLASAPAEAVAAPAVAAATVDDDGGDAQIEICIDLEMRRNALESEIAAKKAERARYQGLLNRYEAAGAGGSAGANAMRGFIATLDAEIAGLELELLIVNGLIAIHCNM